MARKKNALTAYQKKLINQLLITPKVKDAAEAVSMSYDYARQILTKHHVLDALLEAQQRVAERAEIDASWVLRQQKRVYERCMQDVPVKGPDGKELGEYKFEHAGANKALENIGKHVKVNAFKAVDGDGVPIDENIQITVVSADGKMVYAKTNDT